MSNACSIISLFFFNGKAPSTVVYHTSNNSPDLIAPGTSNAESDSSDFFLNEFSFKLADNMKLFSDFQADFSPEDLRVFPGKNHLRKRREHCIFTTTSLILISDAEFSRQK